MYSTAMRAWLLPLRRAGALLPDDRPAPDWAEGFFRFTERRKPRGTARVLEFRKVGDPHTVPLAGELFEPVLVRLDQGTLVFRGIERVRQGRRLAAVVQEWRIDVARAVPPGGHYGSPLGELAPAVR